MANEKRGLMAEAVVFRALEKISKANGKIVFWNEKSEGMTVVPDLTIGTNKDLPEDIFLITASGAEHNSHMKFMRNVAEFFEGKVQVSSSPSVHSIYALSKQKARVKNLLDSLVDSSIHIDDDAETEYITYWLEKSSKEKAVTKSDRLKIFDREIETDAKLINAFEKLVIRIGENIGRSNLELRSLWKLMREDYDKYLADPPIKSKETFVKRGLAQLMILDRETRDEVYLSLNNAGLIKCDPPEYAIRIGLFRKTIGGYKLENNEIENVIKLLGSETCELLISRVPSVIHGWIDELRNLGDTDRFGEYIVSNIEILSDPKVLLEKLLECRRDPKAFANSVGIALSGDTNRVWLFTSIMDLIKASTGRLTGYGYSQLSAEIGDSAQISAGYIGLADWANRTEGENFPSQILTKVSNALSERLSKIDVSRKDKLLDNFINSTKKSILEDRLIPYRHFEPLVWMIEMALKSRGAAYSGKIPMAGWLSEFADSGKGIATTPFIKIDKIAIHWKSVSNAGKVHKKKELAARARLIKYHYDPMTGSFSRRPEIDRLVLIVDGTFNEDDLRILHLSGWDNIIYPDEIEEFVCNIANSN